MVIREIQKFIERWFGSLLVAGVLLVTFWGLSNVIRDANADKAVVIYTPQSIERVDPDTGVVSVPLLDGFDGPAICIGDTVPVRGLRINVTQDPIPLSGTVIWEQIPPGERIFVAVDLPGIAESGTSVLAFENAMPEQVRAMTVAQGKPSKWAIKGSVEVHAPNALTAGFSTARFWVVDCGD